ncbi:hypothetical protein AB3I36_02375 [Enterococcus sp. C27]|uniref:hypothetical protein n=1 Tax=Enterococcus sp. C27 TaxID=3231278 RepID=UPI00349FF3E3
MNYDILKLLYVFIQIFLLIILLINIFQLVHLHKKVYPKISLRKFNKYNRKIQNYLKTVSPVFKKSQRISFLITLTIFFFVGLMLPKFFNNQPLQNIDYLYLGIALTLSSGLVTFNCQLDQKKTPLLCQYLKDHPDNELNIIQIKQENKDKIYQQIAKCSRSLFLLGICFIIGYFFIK